MWNFFDIALDMGLNVSNTPDTLPESPGWYLLFSEEGNFIYVGKTDNLRRRMREHFSDQEQNVRIKVLARWFVVQPTLSEPAAEIWEGRVYDHWVRTTGNTPIATLIAQRKRR